MAQRPPLPVSSVTVAAIAGRHLRHFENLCRRAIDGQDGIRLDECVHLLKLWRSVVDAAGKELPEDEDREVRAALDSGDFDDLIHPTEVEAVRRWRNGDPLES